MPDGLADAVSSTIDLLHAPLLASVAPSVTPMTLLLAMIVVLAGFGLNRVAQQVIHRIAASYPEATDARITTARQMLRLSILMGTALTAMFSMGVSMSMLHFVWGLFNRPVLVVAETGISVVTVVTVVLIVVAGYRLSELLQQALSRWGGSRENLDEGSIGTAQRLLHYVVVGLAVVIAMQTIGINLDALLAAGAVFAVGVGLALQGIAQNFVSGVILLLEQSIRRGDVVEVDGKLVRVEEMAVRSTVVVGLDGDRHILPNSALVQSKVKNLTMKERPVRVHCRVGVAYHLDPVAVTDVLFAAARRVPGRLDDHEPTVLFDNFGDHALEFDVFVWIPEPWQLPEARAALNIHVWQALRENAMPIPYPQRDVHLIATRPIPVSSTRLAEEPTRQYEPTPPLEGEAR